MKLPLITFFFTICWCFYCDAQIGEFKKALANPKAGHAIKYKDDSSDSEITYLGKIKDEKGEVVYYVLKEFYRIQGAIVMRGHSRIVFLDKNKSLVAEYRFSLPEDLPKELIKNSLYFDYVDEGDNKREHLQEIGLVLPDSICVQPNDCYTKE